jgi:Activator of Hsp90 ATPase, N-terminal
LIPAEKDCTEWAKEKLSAMLQTSAGGEWKVTKATIGSGDASVARVRGSKRFIFGMENVVLEWDFRDGEASGKIRVSDFDGTDDEYEFMDFVIAACDDDSLRSTLSSPGQQTPLRNTIQNQIKEWVKLFHETY